jgi:PLP dependent protein
MQILPHNESVTPWEIKQNLRKVKQRIRQACQRAGRDENEVQLLLATKTVPAEKIAAALQEGECLIGENKVQEGLFKSGALGHYPIQWHMIGHLQSNKVKQVLRFAHVIESVDRLSLAEKLQRRLSYENRILDIFIQVNTSSEPSKFGVAPEKALDFIRTVSCMERLRIKGLMTIGVFSAEPEKVRQCFRLLKTIQQQVMEASIAGVAMQELSMGMSHDLEIAIEEGATIVRVGSAIFGKRKYPDSYYWNESEILE